MFVHSFLTKSMKKPSIKKDQLLTGNVTIVPNMNCPSPALPEFENAHI